MQDVSDFPNLVTHTRTCYIPARIKRRGKCIFHCERPSLGDGVVTGDERHHAKRCIYEYHVQNGCMWFRFRFCQWRFGRSPESIMLQAHFVEFDVIYSLVNTSIILVDEEKSHCHCTKLDVTSFCMTYCLCMV